jgi:hypothetical protein|tara:strand:+ start:3254 stop:3553 length:300 start_codon:yes stop_codon:yes gene_type:complete
MGLKVETIDLTDIERLQKQSIRSDISVDLSPVVNEERPLKGITSEQRNRNLKASDVLNIGAGTRCTHCAMLHFLWRENCGGCSKPMEYNLGFVDKENLE